MLNLHQNRSIRNTWRFQSSVLQSPFNKMLLILLSCGILIACKTRDKSNGEKQAINNRKDVKSVSKDLGDIILLKDDSTVLSDSEEVHLRFPIRKDSIYYEDSKINCSVKINFFEIAELGDSLIESKISGRLSHSFGIEKRTNICEENTELESEYRVTHFSKKLLSVFISKYYHYANAAHGDRNTGGLNLNLENGGDVHLKDIIEEKSIGSFNDHLIKILLRKYYDNDSTDFYKEHYISQLFNPNFIINQKGIVVFFKGMSEADGYLEIGVSFKSFYQDIKKEYKSYLMN